MSTNGIYHKAQETDTVPLGEPVYTVKEAAQCLDKSISRIYTLIYQHKLKSYAQDIAMVVLQRDVHALKEQPLLPPTETTPTEMPVMAEPAQLSKLDEIAALNTVITKVFAQVSQPATLTKLEEIPPTVRMWQVQVQTLTCLKSYRVLFDGEAFSVSEQEA